MSISHRGAASDAPSISWSPFGRPYDTAVPIHSGRPFGRPYDQCIVVSAVHRITLCLLGALSDALTTEANIVIYTRPRCVTLATVGRCYEYTAACYSSVSHHE